MWIILVKIIAKLCKLLDVMQSLLIREVQQTGNSSSIRYLISSDCCFFIYEGKRFMIEMSKSNILAVKIRWSLRWFND